MKLLLDQGLPRSTIVHLRIAGIDAFHAGDHGLATANDSRILDFGRQEGMAVVTLDADFHKLLAMSGERGPSVSIRIEGLRGEVLATLLVNVLKVCQDELRTGAVVSVTKKQVRIRKLPIVAHRIY
jgi:predicted nuclease of predicted toxin-antitoxin system